MGKISIDELDDYTPSSNNTPRPKFFGLKNHGDSALIRTYVHLLVYRTDEQGKQVVSHEVFDRGRDYIEKIATLAEAYPPLYDTVFMIKRNGKAGDQGTTYDFLPLPAQTYNQTNYPYSPEDLSYESALGTIIWDKSKEDIQQYLATGEFPRSGKKAEEVKQAPAQPQVQPQPQVQVQPQAQMFQQPQPTGFTGFSATDYPVGPRRRV